MCVCGALQEKEWYQPNRAFVQGGNLVLESVVEESHGLPYTSGWVDTQGSFATAQGMFVINAKLPFGDGMWPAHVRQACVAIDWLACTTTLVIYLLTPAIAYDTCAPSG